MKRFLGCLGLYVMAIVSYAEEESSTNVQCTPAFMEKNKKYYLTIDGKERLVKVLDSESVADSCWLKIKEVIPASVNLELVAVRKKERYWVNLQHVSRVQTRAQGGN